MSFKALKVINISTNISFLPVFCGWIYSAEVPSLVCYSLWDSASLDLWKDLNTRWYSILTKTADVYVDLRNIKSS